MSTGDAPGQGGAVRVLRSTIRQKVHSQGSVPAQSYHSVPLDQVFQRT